MIRIIRKPGHSENNREHIELVLPNDANPNEVSDFLGRFFKLMFDVVEVEDDKDTKSSRSIGFAISEPVENLEDDIDDEDIWH